MFEGVKNKKKLVDFAKKMEKIINNVLVKVSSVEGVEVFIDWKWKVINIIIKEDLNKEEITRKLIEAINKWQETKQKIIAEKMRNLMKEMKVDDKLWNFIF